MGQGQRDEFHRRIHELFHTGTVTGLTDGQLLERFSTRRGEGAELAFAALVDRHGPMVIRVCRGVLRDPHDSEDAFQATFLVLARKARSIRRGDSVGSWLYGVALRVAADARFVAARRRVHERKAASMRGESVRDGDSNDWGPVVHEEVGRLPERFRAAVVLCYMQGRTCEEAAHQLGWPVGTVKSRLARGRERLHHRLIRRGLSPCVGVGAILATEPARAAVPVAKSNATVQLALQFAMGPAVAGDGVTASACVDSLAKGALKTMLLNKLGMAAFTLLALGALITGVRELAGPASGAPPRENAASDAPPRGNPGRIYLAAERGVMTLPNYSIIALDPKTGGETRILDGCWIRPRVSPDGRTVAFWREDALWSRSVAGGDEPKRVLDVGNRGGSPPVWSPDGRQIVVSVSKKGEGRVPWVHTTVRVDVDGTGRTELRIPPEDQVHDWSADGQWLLTASSRNAKIGWQLYVMRPDGSGQRQLTEGGNPYYARFSPEGRRVLYSDGVVEESAGIWVMDLDGKDRRRVFASGKSDASGCWSPDGMRIAVVLSPRKSGQGGDEGSQVEVITLDGTHRTTFQLFDDSSLNMPDWR